MPQFTEWLRGLFRMVSDRKPHHHQLLKLRMYLGGMLSAAIHLVAFVFIFTSTPDTISGIASNSLTGRGNDTGTFQSVNLITTKLNLPATKALSEKAATHSEPEKLPQKDPADTDIQFEDIPSPKPDVINTPSLQGEADDVSNTSDAAANGLPDGTQSILTQIARCLPTGIRPVLAGAQLQLELNETGALLTVPKINIDLAASSKADVKSANQIIQAALQCGPYAIAKSDVRSFAFSPDFSGIP